jgi:hypothetical protein
VNLRNFNELAFNHHNFIIINPGKRIPRIHLTTSIEQSAFAVESIVLDDINWNVYKLLSVLSVLSVLTALKYCVCDYESCTVTLRLCLVTWIG